MANEKTRKKILKEFSKSTTLFRSTLKDLKYLDKQQKNQVKDQLEEVTDVIADAFIYLD